MHLKNLRFIAKIFYIYLSDMKIFVYYVVKHLGTYNFTYETNDIMYTNFY